MRFNYVKERIFNRPKKDWPKRPKLPIALSYESNRQNMYALVDSGADLCLFNSGIGRLLGIDLSSGPEIPVGGIGSAITARLKIVRLQVYGIPNRIEIVAGFTESPNVEGLLGGSGFFDSFFVAFERYKWEFEVSVAPRL